MGVLQNSMVTMKCKFNENMTNEPHLLLDYMKQLRDQFREERLELGSLGDERSHGHA
jgi:hypothetical protein